MDSGIRRHMLALMPRLRRFTYGLTGTADRGDDLLQSTYERAIREIHRWEPGTRLDAWMYRIARNLHLNELRAQSVRRDALPDLELHHGAPVDGTGQMEAQITFARVRELVAQLPEEQGSVLLLVTVEGLSYKEVSEVTGLPMGTIASRLARAREFLKTRLGLDDQLTVTAIQEKDDEVRQ